MDDALLVGVVDGARQRLDQAGRMTRGPGTGGAAVLQAAPLDVLQAEKGQPFVFANFVDLHNIWMPKSGDCLGLLVEAGLQFRPGVGAGEDHLEGNGAIEVELPCLVDDAHPPATQLALDQVTGDGRPVHGGAGLARRGGGGLGPGAQMLMNVQQAPQALSPAGETLAPCFRRRRARRLDLNRFPPFSSTSEFFPADVFRKRLLARWILRPVVTA